MAATEMKAPPSALCGRLAGAVLALLLAWAASAEEQPDYFQPEPFELRKHAELELRQEWTEPFGLRAAEDRRRARLLAGFDADYRWLGFGVLGDFIYSSDDNVAGLGDPGRYTQRDNYRSRDARVDLAYARLEPAAWLRLEAGRFPMPLALTGLTWDEDLRLQGAAFSVGAQDLGAVRRLGLSGFGARGSHVFDDSDTEMWAVAGEIEIELGPVTTLERQNTIRDGRALFDYDILDVVARFSYDGAVEVELVADACRNLAADEGKNGLWVALAVDGATWAPAHFEYVYVWVDRDATVAAYPADDFLWTTGWEGHAADLGVRLGAHAAVHVIGQLQRYKDAPRVEARDDWVGRLRIELRLGL